MAGAEERGGAASGRSRSARDHHRSTSLGLAVAALVLTRPPAALAQTAPPATAPPGGGGAGAAPGTGTSAGEAAGPANTTTPAAAAARTPAWTYIPAVSIDESFTDNVFSTATQRQSDLITTLAPSLFITGESPKLQGVFNYSPEAVEYAVNSSQDQIQQNLFTNGTLTAVPNLLFFDGSASISNQSRTGGRGFDNAAQIPTSQATQTIVYTGSPYLRFHLGDDGDAELRYAFSQTVFNGNTGPVTNTLTGQNLGSISNSTQHAATFTYNTGDAFSRLQFSFLSSYIQFIAGNGALDSRHATDTVNATYAVTNVLSALFGGGYEKLTYPQQSQDNFSGPNWDIGARYQPREDRQITLTYGAVEGQDTFTGSMLYAVTGDATLSASYSQQNSTQQQQLLQNLAGATQTVPGITINPTTGLPQSITNPNLALQNSVFRAQNFQAGLTVNR
ncbi:MAG TPA: TIGR03016 family PEP-CTERM system-associated outer membrane protein, partial [Solirubrobacteraceae bacterium]|nr:TIGR03016 family PEP-CTERM system-associated outer membrane protein [Solirubrobacteraceae bacterium]